jgi:hypothetical protein
VNCAGKKIDPLPAIEARSGEKSPSHCEAKGSSRQN